MSAINTLRISHLLPGLSLVGLLLAQVTVADWKDWDISAPSLALACLLAAISLALCHRQLLSVAMRLPILISAVMLFWLFLSTQSSLIAEFSLLFFWFWCYALMVALCVACHTLAGSGMLAVGILLVPLLLRSLWVVHSYAIRELPANYIFDPNISSDIVLIAALLPVALLAPGPQDTQIPRRTWHNLVLFVLLGCCMILLHWGFAARITLMLALAGWTALLWPSKQWIMRLMPLLVFVSVVSTVQVPERLGINAVYDDPQSQISARLDMIRAGLDIFLSYPLTGAGGGTFGYLFQQIYMDADFSLNIGGTLVHNDWVQLLAETGLPLVLGLLIFAALCARGWVVCAAALMAGKDEQHIRLALGCFSGVAVVLAHALTNFPLQDPATLALTLAMGGCGLMIMHDTAWAPEWTQRHNIRMATLAAGLLTGLTIIWMYWRLLVHAAGFTIVSGAPLLPWLGHLPESSRPQWISPSWSPDEQFQFASRLTTLIPDWAGGWYLQGAIAGKTLHTRDKRGEASNPQVVAYAERAFTQAQAMNPYISTYYAAHAHVLEHAGVHDAAPYLRLLVQHKQYTPHTSDLLQIITRILNKSGQQDLAVHLLEDWLPRCPRTATRAPKRARALLQGLSPDAMHRHQAEIQACQQIVDLTLLRQLHIRGKAGSPARLSKELERQFPNCRFAPGVAPALYDPEVLLAQITPPLADGQSARCQQNLARLLLLQLQSMSDEKNRATVATLAPVWRNACTHGERYYLPEQVAALNNMLLYAAADNHKQPPEETCRATPSTPGNPQ